MNKIKELAGHCNHEERCRITKMLRDATWYIEEVILMEGLLEFHKRHEDFKKAHQLSERRVCMAYDDFVSSVNDVNGLCDT